MVTLPSEGANFLARFGNFIRNVNNKIFNGRKNGCEGIRRVAGSTHEYLVFVLSHQ